ncbi:MAG: twin-arginine translocase subunit TatC [Rhizobiales bacterium]|nr:twin-arginine translocase subunit TatC [Hyphomicrobiales bacterium]
MSDQDIEASRAPLVEHLGELRQRLMWAILAIAVAFVVCFYFATDIYNLLVYPYAVAAGVPIGELKLIQTAPQEWFFTQIKLALFGAMFIAFPVIATQIYMFVAPGLYKNERGAFLPYLFATPVLFALGAALVYFFIMPLAMAFFLSLQPTGEEQVKVELTAKVSEYLGLIMTLILAFGICFQLPVVLTLLARVGLIGSDTLRRNRKYAVVAVFVVAAVLTPPDLISQIGLAVPTLLLYEGSIWAVRIIERRREQESPAEEA